MDARPQSFDAIFQRQVQYVVPLFQRRYVWNEENQWEPLWRDVLEIVEECVEEMRESGQMPIASDLPVHFLGAIVVKLVPFGAGQTERREVIDGQQRLTTVQLLIAAAVRTLEEFGESERAGILKELVLNTHSIEGDQPDSDLKVLPTKHDRNAYRAAVMGAESEEWESDLITQAFTFFRTSIVDWGSALEDGERAVHFQALDAVLRRQLRVVWIDLDDNDNAQVIFETLNDRGAPLNAIDLVKNLVFQRQTDTEEAEALYERHWSWIEDDWWQEKLRLGRLERVRADIFLQHWLQMHLCREVNSDYLFQSFAKMFRADSPDVSTLIPEFAADARIYRGFYDPPAGTMNPVRTNFFRRLDLLDTSTPMPLLLSLFKLEGDTLAADDLDQCLVVLEDYLVRRMLWRGTTQAYNRVFTELVGKTSDGSGPPLSVLSSELAQMEGDSQLWPRDENLVEVLTEKRAYGTGAIASRRLKDVLWEVELRLRSDMHEDLERPPNLEIEHIMPQEWKENWPLPQDTARPEELLAADRDTAVQRLGNLTLVTEKLNPSLSNSAWDEKRPALTRHSLLAMNQKIVSDYETGFDEEDIATRGEWLAGEILKCWPGPVEPSGE